MSDQLQGKRIAFLIANEGVEQVELTEPARSGPRGRRRGRAARARSGRDPGLQPPRQGRHLLGRQSRRRCRRRATTTGWCCRAASPTPTSCAPTPEAVEFVRAFFEAGKPVGAICHGPWTLIEADVVARPHPHLVAEPADRPAQRRRRVGRRGGPRRPGPGHQPQARRPAGLQRQDRRGVRRGRARGPARGEQRS